ncbi:MAG: hypothetical protein FVQ81_02220 [Candidatus Glassbacteria bacterium]|nr:hypothetical protein [Candidatus Glassbacteria bacterium]
MPKLICVLLMYVLGSATVMARQKLDSVWVGENLSFRVVHEHAAFDIIQSTRFFNRKCITTLDCVDYPLGGSLLVPSLAPKADKRNLEERIADSFETMTAYPGGLLLYNTICAGLDLMVYSRDLTSIQYDNLKIGSRFGGAGRGFLKTGVFYDF